MPELVFLSIIQGVTEFLPVSSSAHLILISKYLNFNNSNLKLDISLHLGSLLAIIFYFKEDLKNFYKNKELFKKILITALPILIVGYLLIKTNYIDVLRSYIVIGWSTIIFGIILYISDLKKTKRKLKTHLNYKSTFFIGIFQVLSLIPGVSRSGITITSARLLGFDRIDSAKISFLTSLPVLILISIHNIQKIFIEKDSEIISINLMGVTLSFVFSYLTIRFFLIYLKKFNLSIFVIYRLILGIAILLYVYR